MGPLAHFSLHLRPMFIQEGGLGFWSLVCFNQALLGWLWWHLTEKNAYCRIVIASKYGSMWGNWITDESLVSVSHGVSLLKYIQNGWNRLVQILKFVVVSGANILFWSGCWCGDMMLFQTYSGWPGTKMLQWQMWCSHRMGLFFEMTYLQGPVKTGSWNLCSLSSTIDILQK